MSVYTIIKPMLDKGDIQAFSDIFTFIPFSIVADDIGKRNSRFKELIERRVDEFEIKEVLIIARLCALSNIEMFKLIDNELTNRQSKLNATL